MINFCTKCLAMTSITKSKLTSKLQQNSNKDQISKMSINEKILRECYNMYTDTTQGLVTIAKEFDIQLLPPRKKITVLLLGNHSAGKSSFINWYIEEHIQKTGVAIETQGFILVTSGKRRECLTGNATVQLYPYLKPLTTIPGVLDFLSTEVTTSKQKKFNLVTFIDTPGLVDGDMKYPFDVNNALHWMGELADLIFVFFDPIGQAFCKRTLDIIEKLNVDYANKVRLYLSKIDEVTDEADRQKVMMQIVQELCRRKGLNRTGFEMPSIFIPDAERKSNRCANQIEAVCKEIERTIENTVQNTLNTLGKDAENTTVMLDMHINRDNKNRAENREKTFTAVKYGLAFLILFMKYCLLSEVGKRLMKLLIGQYASTLFWILDPIETWLPDLSGKFMPHLLLIMLFGAFVLYKYKDWTYKPTLSSRQRKRYLSLRSHVSSVIRSKELLYKEYLEQCVSDQDL